MKRLTLSNLQVADLCRELALLMHAGIGLGDGLHLMAQEEKQEAMQTLLTEMAEQMDVGAFLSDTMRQAGCFPSYVTGLISVGETSGRLEDSLNALAQYYEERDRMDRQVRSTLTYPAILLVLMLAVIVVLLSKVLPVFNEIYGSLGGKLTGIAGGLLAVGQVLDRGMPILCGVLGLAVLFGIVLALCKGLRSRIMGFWHRHWGDKGVSRLLNNARFAQALYMGFSSGLPMEEAVDMAGILLKEIPPAADRCKQCRELLDAGEELSAALGQTGLMDAAASRLLLLGMRSGTGDNVMQDIAQRMSDQAKQRLEQVIARIEPALVLLTSVMVGVILLAVMLPLMNIMTAIG